MGGGGVLVAALTALTVSLVLQPLAIRLLVRRAVLDLPSARSNHKAATPRGGGIAVVAAVAAGLVVSGEPLAVLVLAGVGVAAAVGLVEDLRGLGVTARLGLVALAGAAFIPAVLAVPQEQSVRLALVAAVALPWTVAVVNAVNFMDGINGISVAQGVVGGLAYAALGAAADVPVLAVVGLVVAGAALGFAPYNVPRARVFLGDVGSYGLGAALAGLALLAVAAGLPVEAAVGPVALYGADTLTTLLRRVRAGETWHAPHRRHVYQQLVSAGLSHTRVSATVAVLIGAVSGLSALSLVVPWPARLVTDAVAVAVAVGYLAAPELLRRRRTARAPRAVSV